MRIVVSGTHASGKSTLIADFARRSAGFEVFPDPFELLDEAFDDPDVDVFLDQLWLAADRLVELPAGARVIAERGPLDFVAYLDALEALGRPAAPAAVRRRGLATAVEAMRHVDLFVVLPLSTHDHIEVPEDEDPELRAAMDAALLDLVDDPVVAAGTRVLEVSGPPEERLAQLVAAAAG
ncbi:AAA family ATPase [Euzebya pacifica]|uniref:AAA family ATPase n=1 Tax=Euzebya pacifica TaxID=1608957 RepID=UPI0030F615F7